MLPSGGTSWAGGNPNRGAAPCRLATGSRHMRPGRGRCLRQQSPAMPAGGRPRLVATAPAREFWSWQAAPVQGALAAAGLTVGGRPCMGAGNGWPPLLLIVLVVNT
ncbi:hypothetical protein OPV22_000193 [Ensete ventricosum]|uniref:Uncharacterized protein n=1 Tax=Ensete ventricosum TaxID=4639 RepID=A0AAV8RTW9_ENSVE|nr:hypothetical protein OPV22_000193 [Ensete ventricosum]